MLFSFKNKELRNICEDDTLAEKSLGKNVADKLKVQLANINAISTLSDLILGNLRKDEKNSVNYVIDITPNYALIFEPIFYSSVDNANEIELYKKIRRVKILEITHNND